MKNWQIELRQSGLTVKFWSYIRARTSLEAIDKVAINPLSCQEWIAREIKVTE